MFDKKLKEAVKNLSHMALGNEDIKLLSDLTTQYLSLAGKMPEEKKP